MSRASYTVYAENATTVYIRDMSNFTGGVTVTNDAEAVTKEVIKKYPGKKIFYIDSLGDMAELVHDGAVFKRFRPI